MTPYIENSRSIVLTQRTYRGQQSPSDNTLRSLVPNLVEHGTVWDRSHAIHPRPRRLDELAQNPNESCRHRAHHFRVNGTTLRRILKDDLHLFPYKVQLTQRMLPTDRPRRLEYGQIVAGMVDTEPDF